MIGKTVEHYRITERLGAGGMGEVYRARDTRLERDVAIKVLPDGFAQDSGRRARFEREARLLAALNHPNVAAIYELTEVGGVHYLVMEYVPGRALRVPLPIGEALAVCRQVAEGLEAAHERGIIHRDLKPQNIVLTPEGKAKVLDFGLAKIVPEALDIAQSPTMSHAHTEMGQVMGTVAYMSPEQARGLPLDRRTDIWAFGCVLYETLSGVRAFPGATHSDTLAAVLTSDPDERRLPPEVPPRVRDLLRRCLRKDPSQRLRDIGDARLELEEAIAGNAGYPGALPSLPTPRGAVRGRHLLPLALALAVAAAGGWWLGDRSRETPDALGALQVHRLTDFIGLEESPAVSPDGKAVAFTAAVEGRKQIWVRLLAGGAPLQLTRDRVDHMAPRWTPDSGAILYHSAPDEAGTGGALFEISALGGAARRVTDSLGEGDVSHDGKSVAYFASVALGKELRVCARDGSGARTVARLETNRYAFPRWSPDDRWIAYQRGGGPANQVVEVTPSAGGEPRRAIEDGALLSGFTWLKDGSGFVYSSSRGSTIMYLPTFNLWSASLGSDEARQITFGEGAYVEPDLAASVLVASRIKRSSDIWRFPVDGTPRENVLGGVRISRQTGEVRTPSVGPGGREVVYLSDGGGHGNLWILAVDGSGEARQITFESDPGTSMGLPVWSPDGPHRLRHPRSRRVLPLVDHPARRNRPPEGGRPGGRALLVVGRSLAVLRPEQGQSLAARQGPRGGRRSGDRARRRFRWPSDLFRWPHRLLRRLDERRGPARPRAADQHRTRERRFADRPCPRLADS